VLEAQRERTKFPSGWRWMPGVAAVRLTPGAGSVSLICLSTKVVGKIYRGRVVGPLPRGPGRPVHFWERLPGKTVYFNFFCPVPLMCNPLGKQIWNGSSLYRSIRKKGRLTMKDRTFRDGTFRFSLLVRVDGDRRHTPSSFGGPGILAVSRSPSKPLGVTLTGNLDEDPGERLLPDSSGQR